jgi:Flp pilus assembly protein TadG
MVRLAPFTLQSLHANDGNVAVMFAVMLPLIVGGAGLGVETTYWRYKQLQLQAAADAAAFAGAMEKRAGSDQSIIAAAASTAASQNGFAVGAGTIAVATPVGNPTALEVVLRADAPRFFSGALLNTPVPLRARAVAEYDGSSAVCVLALEPAAPQSLIISGSAEVTLQGCNMMANSIASDAVVVQGSAELTAPCVISVGGASITGDLNLTACPSVITQAPRAADPYKDLTAPSATGSCLSDHGSVLTPGRYCSGMDLGDATLQPGVYVVSGGDLRINAHAEVQGTGVTIYLQGSARLHVDGSAEVVMSAPTSGPYSGILFFGDRASLGGSNIFNGTASSSLTGALYFPSQAVEYRGNFSGENGCTQVVARTVQWTGNSSVGVDCTSLGMQTVPTMSVVKLVE